MLLPCLGITIRHLTISIFTISIFGPTLALRASLLLIHARLRLRHLPDLAVAAVGRSERLETVLSCRSRWPAALIHLSGLRGARWTNPARTN
jgi:hypothetical protein